LASVLQRRCFRHLGSKVGKKKRNAKKKQPNAN
jgi:hypothetical protein